MSLKAQIAAKKQELQNVELELRQLQLDYINSVCPKRWESELEDLGLTLTSEVSGSKDRVTRKYENEAFVLQITHIEGHKPVTLTLTGKGSRRVMLGPISYDEEKESLAPFVARYLIPTSEKILEDIEARQTFSKDLLATLETFSK